MKRHNILIVVVLLLAGAVGIASAQRTQHKEINRGNERELKVIIEVSFGTVIIAPGEGGKILVADFTGSRDNDSKEVVVDYTSRGDRGELIIKSKDHSRFWNDSDNEDTENRVWTLRFTDAVPLDMKIELGAGKGELDLTGMQLRTLKISSGASSVDMFCDTPNPIDARVSPSSPESANSRQPISATRTSAN
ncbi:MAG TPA: toast rack family protein [Bacteroidota bacterium]